MQHIQNILQQIEQQKNIQVLFACETGSRAWGFPSPDSDFDVRFIYMHKRDWYLSLNRQKDTIEIMDGEWDITGWDLRKTLTLLKKSNVPLIERFNSPIAYMEQPGFKADFKKLIDAYYSPIAAFFHHYSLAKKFWEEVKDKETVKLKSYFYLIRSLLSCSWIIKDTAVLPMHIEGLMLYVQEDYKTRLRELIQLKATVGEKYLHPKDAVLNDWITGLFRYVEKEKEKLAVNKTGMHLLNEFFLKAVYAETDH